VASHGNGCRHYGILDLSTMDSKNYLYYSKPGCWLEGKTCCNCQLGIKDMTMDKATKCFLRYCEMGLKGSRYNENGNKDDKELFLDHHCDMVLCVKCWNIKVSEHEKMEECTNGIRSKRCSLRVRST